MKEDPNFDNLLREAVKLRGIASPGVDFVPKVMRTTRNQPLLSKDALLSVVCLFVFAIVMFAFFSPNTESLSPLSNFFNSVRWLDLPKFKLPELGVNFIYVSLIFVFFPFYLHFLMKKKAGS